MLGQPQRSSQLELGKLEGGHSIIFPENGFIEMQDVCSHSYTRGGWYGVSPIRTNHTLGKRCQYIEDYCKMIRTKLKIKLIV